jgi:hypothetical protein
MSRGATLGWVIVAGVVTFGAPAESLAQAWSVDVAAGRTVYEPLSANFGTNNLIGTVRYDARRGAWVYGSAALPLGNQAPFWDSAGTGGRFTRRGSRAVTLGTEVGGYGFMFRDVVAQQMGNGAILEAIPFVNLSEGAMSVEVRGGWRGQTLSFAGTTENRGVFETGVRLAYDAAVHLQGDIRWVRASEGVYPFVGATIAYATVSPVSVWARAGKWASTQLDNAAWGIGTAVAINTRSSLWASVQQDAPDPLYWNAQRRSWTIGLTHRLTRPAAPLLPTPAAQTGGVIIRISVADAPAGSVSIAGSFNNWKPQPMQREGGDWIIRLPLAAGVYQYAFRSATGEWFVPTSVAGRRDDGMGGHEAVLVVS